ncbi:MAG: tRNA (guanosine(37)-N1)-methyltransferase TrmD [Candidatus Edwardsbacteria bacterium]|nr:tRNA (guanosine(37)-N1)-methyltransferase TrmD [Candidatus Edwardsbacteria bacterium]
MRITVLTLFPEMFPAALDASIVGGARKKGLVEFNLVNIRDFALDKHQVSDDTPYGGGPGMIMKPEPIYRAARSLETAGARPKLILLSPRGRPYDQATARELSKEPDLALLCGHYKDIDERVRAIIDLDISIGDYILSGGEIAALAVIDSIVRLLPGAISDPESADRDSFETGLLDHPHYTRPEEFEGMKVPEILRSGNHAAIRRWRRKQALLITKRLRPDLLEKAELSGDDIELLDEEDM